MNLYKRSNKPDAPWYVRFQVKGRPYVWSTKTADKALAAKYAKQYREARVSENYGLASRMLARDPTPTFDGLFKVYYSLLEPENQQTKARNVRAMQIIMRASGLGLDSRINLVGERLAEAYKVKARAENMSPATVNSTLRMAKSLFSRSSVKSYRAARVNLPMEQINEFMAVDPMKEPKRRPELPAQPAMATALASLPALPAHYRAFLLAGVAGLRAGEIIAARKDWVANGVIRIGGTADFTAKDNDWRDVAIAPDVASLLLAGHGEYIVGDNGTQVCRELIAMLKGYGFPRKPLQSLRRLAGSMIAASSGGVMARDFLGHSSIATTERYYVGAMGLAAPISLERIAAPVAQVTPPAATG